MHMRTPLASVALLGSLILAASLTVTGPAPAHADEDGPDCGRVTHDFGDAPEGIPVWGLSGGVLARFPTCVGAALASTQETACPPLGTAPGPSGFVHHTHDGTPNYWLGCFVGFPGGPEDLGEPFGIDGEVDGTFNVSGPTSECSPIVGVDCVEAGTGMGQDECFGDQDAGVGKEILVLCYDGNRLPLSAWNCGDERTVILNVLVDLNLDGDWNDNGPCGGGPIVACAPPCGTPDGCAHEWAVKNVPVTLAPGCNEFFTPFFHGGTGGPGGMEGPGWVRVTLTDHPVDDDFPWAGSAHRPGGTFAGGETEDYLVQFTAPDPVTPSTWGGLKLRYR